MKIIDYKNASIIRSENTKLHLLQPSISLDPQTKRIQDPEEVWNQISLAIGGLEIGEKCDSRIIVLPEVSVPRVYAQDTLHLVFGKFSGHTVLIFGLELCTVEECQFLIKALTLLDNEPLRFWSSVNKERLVNACIIAIGEGDGAFKVLFQPKLTPSKFEGSLDQLEDVVTSDYLYRIIFKDASIMVLICSDFFNRPSGGREKIIDIVSRYVLETDEPLDFIFNIQYNPSVDHPLFINSISRFYDDGYMTRATACLIQVNSLIEKGLGAKSKILFYKGASIPRTEPVKQINAPVVGYELGSEASSTSITFKRLPREWDRYRDKYPLSIQMKLINNDVSQSKPLSGISYVMPVPLSPPIDLSSYRDVCNRLSEVGQLRQAEEWARYGFEQYLDERRWHQAAELMQFVAIQLRHSGSLDRSLQAYALAEEVLWRTDDPSFDNQLLNMRIRAGRVMVEEYLIRGNALQALQRYDNMLDEIDEYLEEKRETLLEGEKRTLRRYKLHGMRQQGEMHRITGEYKKALQYFRYSYDNIDYMCPRAKAFSMLGIADSLRQIGDFKAAKNCYSEAEIYADIHKDFHLKMRLLRGLIEVRIISGNKAEEMITKYREEARMGGFLFAEVYGEIFTCRCLIYDEINAALTVVEKSEKLAQLGGTKLRLEHTHSILAKGEILRRLGDRNSEELFKSALKNYTFMGVKWGIIRATIGLAAINSVDTEALNEMRLLARNSSYEMGFILRAIKDPLSACDMLLVNMP